MRRAALWPDSDALVFPESRETGAELLASAERAARSVVGLGIRSGETVALLMPNHPHFVHLVLGCALIGVRVLLVNARYKAHELSYVLRNGDAVAVVTTDVSAEYVDFVALLAEATADEPPPLLRHRILVGASSPEGFVDSHAFGAAGEGTPADEVARLRRGVRLRDVAILIYTSGTTADPKGCLLSHEALVRTGISVAERFGLAPEERYWDPLPLFHMGGLLPLVANMYAGGAFLSMTYFEPGEALRQMEAEGCTFAYPCFPTITQSLIHHPSFKIARLSRVRAVLDTGPPKTLRDVERQWGVPVLASYGLTEAGGVVSFSHLEDSVEQRTATGGRPLRGMEVRIADPETDEELPVGEVGQILVRGPGLFEGYYKDPEQTAGVVRGGWLHTGDLGRVDAEGRVSYVGRSKDMLKVGGENVAALEIEEFLSEHPAVKIAAVVAVPDAKYLEVPAAFVELVSGHEVGEQELIDYCRGRIASFKIPRYVRFVEEWPVSATKVQKHRLREQILAELGLG